MPIEAISANTSLLGLVHIPDTGSPTALAVLIHGAASDSFDGLVWRISRELAESGIICAAINLSARSLGRYAGSFHRFSGWPWTATEPMVAEVEAFVRCCADRYGGHPALIGHSWGSHLVALAAGRVTCTHLSLVSPIGSGRSMLEAMFADRPQVLDDVTRPRSEVDGNDLVHTGRDNLPFLSAATIRDLHSQPALADLTADVSQEIHVFVGDREHESTLRAARDIVAQQPSRRALTSIPGAGHFYRGKESLLSAALAAPVCQR
ncbi:alpha/beta hydrolase [Catellatospora tritici]|uniref:alpha/beta hydrolase n=1 Tax=Catellatospora tritici TaxID=2851566 RepID=UPI001C2DF02D|nr:alpha/beta fold hydrolase [Catellatospora tritici]MBV1850008.1 lysophospholipase [Catellatospora tritici]